METWRYELYHSSGPWKKHKYVKKVGDRYYYPEDTKGSKTSFDLNLFGKSQSEISEEAAEDFRDSQLKKYEKEDSYYKKAPDSILGKVDWALGRIGQGLPIDNKEYQVYFKNGKKHVEAVEDKPANTEQYVSRGMPTTTSSSKPVGRKKNVTSGGTGAYRRGLTKEPENIGNRLDSAGRERVGLKRK